MKINNYSKKIIISLLPGVISIILFGIIESYYLFYFFFIIFILIYAINLPIKILKKEFLKWSHIIIN